MGLQQGIGHGASLAIDRGGLRLQLAQGLQQAICCGVSGRRRMICFDRSKAHGICIGVDFEDGDESFQSRSGLERHCLLSKGMSCVTPNVFAGSIAR